MSTVIEADLSALRQIAELAEKPEVATCLAAFAAEMPQILDQVKAVQQIPAPTFAEHDRACYVAAEFAAIGLVDVRQDELDNVFARLPGVSDGVPVVVSAHLDTVFPAGTDLTLRQDAFRLYGPGISDNAAGVAGLLTVARTFLESGIQPAGDVWFVANVGEEGLGDLRGMRAVVAHFGANVRYIVVEGGLFGQVLNQAVAVTRYRIDVQTEGGHAWKHFGRPSAIHVLGELITTIDAIVVPTVPWTTYNIGLIEGGTSINTIAPAAALWLDLRSTDERALRELEAAVAKMVQAAGQPPEIFVQMSRIGSRPPGRIAQTAPLVRLAAAALKYVGCARVEFSTGSTDANIPLSLGLPAVCIGLAAWGNVHRTDEFIDVSNLTRGLQQLALLILAAANH